MIYLGKNDRWKGRCFYAIKQGDKYIMLIKNDDATNLNSNDATGAIVNTLFTAKQLVNAFLQMSKFYGVSTKTIALVAKLIDKGQLEKGVSSAVSKINKAEEIRGEMKWGKVSFSFYNADNVKQDRVGTLKKSLIPKEFWSKEDSNRPKPNSIVRYFDFGRMGWRCFSKHKVGMYYTSNYRGEIKELTY